MDPEFQILCEKGFRYERQLRKRGRRGTYVVGGIIYEGGKYNPENTKIGDRLVLGKGTRPSRRRAILGKRIQNHWTKCSRPRDEGDFCKCECGKKTLTQKKRGNVESKGGNLMTVGTTPHKMQKTSTS